MGLFAGINWRRVASACALATLVSLSLTGCTGETLDSVRPEINRHQGMLVFPEQYQTGIDEVSDSDGTEDMDGVDTGLNSDGTTGDTSDGGTTIVNASKFEALPYNAMASTSYNQYLDSQVYQPIREILDAKGGDVSSHIYFRVFHSGYVPLSEDTSVIQTGSIYDNRSVGSGSLLRGTTFPNLAFEWLSLINENADRISARRRTWTSTLERQPIDEDTDWLKASTLDGVDENVLKMWGNESVGVETYGDYIDVVKSDVVGTVPQITLKIAVSSGSNSSVYLNNYNNVSGPRYYDVMDKASVDRLFGSYNQFRNREQVKVSNLYEDEYGIVFTYIDGYSKTIVALCCFDGYDLTLLGDDKDRVLSLVRGTYDYTEVSAISEFVSSPSILQAGVKGRD